jgi:UDP-glucuronate decarboxylase
MHEADGRVVSNFIVQALRNQDITLYGDGLQTRSFCYVDDLIESFLRFMAQPGTSGKEPGFPGPINLGNPGEFTIRQLAETVIELTGASSRMIFLPMPTDDPKQRRPNIELARERLGWEPMIALKEGLQKTIAYFDSTLSKPA